MNQDEPTQRTEKGLEIPVPTKDDVLRDLEKTAKPRKKRRLRPRRSKKER